MKEEGQGERNGDFDVRVEITFPLAVDVDDDIPSIVLSSFLHKMDKYYNILDY